MSDRDCGVLTPELIEMTIRVVIYEVATIETITFGLHKNVSLSVKLIFLCTKIVCISRRIFVKVIFKEFCQ